MFVVFFSVGGREFEKVNLFLFFLGWEGSSIQRLDVSFLDD